MIKKKYLLLSALSATLAAGPAFAQESGSTSSASYASRDMTYRGQNYDVLDTSYIPKKRMEQHRKFLNHQYAFPAKPRSMWEIGINGGMYNVSGDVQSLMIWNGGGWGAGVHVRKSIGYLASIRLDYTYGIGKGLQYAPSEGYIKNPAWNGTNTNGAAYTNLEPVFYNYRMEAHQLTMDLVFSLGNVLFHRARPKVDPYIFGGLGAHAYQTWVNALDDNYQKYNFQTIVDKHSQPRGYELKEQKYVRRDLKDLLDDSYETNAESLAGQRSPHVFKTKTGNLIASAGFGFQFRLSERVNLAVEDRATWFPTNNEDLLDGQRWDEQTQAIPGGTIGVPTPNKDAINYLSIGLNFNLGNNKTHVQPLYWINPLDHAYNELSSPRHMILPEPILPDADGDGIADQFDKCPGTPAGVAVDSHGCPMDTDGDGVPDDRDKQLITPTECQPVDADGVGKCPCNCTGLTMAACGNIAPGAILFAQGSSKITPSMEAQLATLAAQMQANPDCKVVVMGNAGGSKVAQQRSWDRVNAVIEYLSEKSQIDRARFIFQYEGQAGENSVNYRSANPGEEGPSNVAPPHPDLRR
jgi:outer membrane protein OmpA-like peptidoglycan-associated protein